jgi:hypothetical protein
VRTLRIPLAKGSCAHGPGKIGMGGIKPGGLD